MNEEKKWDWKYSPIELQSLGYQHGIGGFDYNPPLDCECTDETDIYDEYFDKGQFDLNKNLKRHIFSD